VTVAPCVQQAIDLEQDRRFSGFVTIDGFWRGIGWRRFYQTNSFGFVFAFFAARLVNRLKSGRTNG
jgi:hypothetical protein